MLAHGKRGGYSNNAIPDDRLWPVGAPSNHGVADKIIHIAANGLLYPGHRGQIFIQQHLHPFPICGIREYR
jgi:hypothetical protein